MTNKSSLWGCAVLSTVFVFAILNSGQAAGDASLMVAKLPEVIYIQAKDFQRGDAVLSTWGEPLSIGGKWAEYDFDVAQSGNYVLSVRYAAAESRPVSIFLDGNLITYKGMAKTTGGWAPKTGIWEEQGVLKLSAGKHTIKLQREPCLPHITAFKLIPTGASSEVPVLKERKESLNNLLQNIKTALQPFQNTAEGEKLSGQWAGLEKDLNRVDIGLAASSTVQELDAIEKRADDIRLVLAGLRTERLAGGKDKVVLWASNPLVKIFKDSLLSEKADTRGISIEACRNEYEPAQVGISSYDFQGPVRIKVNPLSHLSGKYVISDVTGRFVGYVPIPKNSPTRNDFLRKAPGLFPDPLILDEEVVLQPRQTQPVWITVKVPKDALPGEYKGSVEVITKAGNAVLPLSLTVYSATLPETTNFWMGAWGGDTILAEELGIIKQGEKNYPPEYFSFLKNETLKNRYEHRNKVFSDVPLWSIFTGTKIFWKDGGYVYDFTLFDKFVSTIEEGLHNQFRIICCGIAGKTKDRKGLLSGKITVFNSDGSVNSEKGLSNISTDDPRYLEFISDFFKAMEAHLRKRGWLDKVYFKVADEVEGEAVSPSLRLSKYIKQAVPEIRLDETVYDPAMIKEEHIDLPLVGTHLLGNPSFVKMVTEEISRGREVWNYNNYLNMFDLPLMHTRIMGWVNYRYGLKGYMHWAWMWVKNPWENAFDEIHGAGAGFLVYPDKTRKKIVDSIRWEMFRETAEDFDTLYLLEKAGGDSQKFCQQLVKSLFDYEQDPERFYQVRHQLLLELNRLSK